MQNRSRRYGDTLFDIAGHNLTRYWCRLQLAGDAGQGLVEYGFTIVLIGIVVIGILAVVGGQIGDLFSELTAEFPGA